MSPTAAQPSINIQINVAVGQLAATDYEVSLKLEGKAESTETPPTLLFAFDLTYAGVFRIQNVPQEQIHPVVMIECPRLLFPFARELIASSVRGGGFPPLLLDPVDFVALYQQRVAQMQQQPRPPPPDGGVLAGVRRASPPAGNRPRSRARPGWCGNPHGRRDRPR